MGRADHRRLEGPRRAGRGARRVRDGRRAPAGGAADGRPAARAARPGRRRDVRQPGRPGARRARRRGAQRLRHRPAARPRRQGRAAAAQRRRLRRRPRRRPGRRTPLPRAARGGPPAVVRARAVAARPPARGRGGLRPRHHHRHVPDRVVDARHRPDQPGRDPGGPGRRAVRAGEVPGPAGRADPSRDHARARRGLGRRGRRPGHRDPDAERRQDAGGGPPPSRRGRSGRVDVRRAGRPRAAPAPAARRVGAVGVAALPQGPGRPRRGVVAPRPAADLGRPRRPAGLPGGVGAGVRVAVRRRVRRRAGGAAGHRGRVTATTAPGSGPTTP